MRSHQGRVDRRAVCHARARVSWGAHGHVARANRSPPSHLKPYQAEGLHSCGRGPRHEGNQPWKWV